MTSEGLLVPFPEFYREKIMTSESLPGYTPIRKWLRELLEFDVTALLERIHDMHERHRALLERIHEEDCARKLQYRKWRGILDIPLAYIPSDTSDVSEAECGKSPKVMAKTAEKKQKLLEDGLFEYDTKTDLQHQMVEGWNELCNNFFRLKKSAVAVFQYLPKHVRDLFHSACKAVSTSAKRMDKLLKVSKVLGVMNPHQQKEKDTAGSASSHMTHHQIAAEILKKFQDEFLEAMDAKALCRRLALKGIIPEKVETEILQAESKEAANIILYRHLDEQGTEADLRQLCEIASMKKGYGMMNELGRKILEQLL